MHFPLNRPCNKFRVTVNIELLKFNCRCGRNQLRMTACKKQFEYCFLPLGAECSGAASPQRYWKNALIADVATNRSEAEVFQLEPFRHKQSYF